MGCSKYDIFQQFELNKLSVLKFIKIESIYT